MDTFKTIVALIFDYLQRIAMNHFGPLNIQRGMPEPKSLSYGPPSPFIAFILGPPGAGKGTQSTALRARFPGLTHLSFGDLIRHHGSIPGDWVTSFPRRYGKEGNYVLPADAAVQLLRQRIEDGVGKGQMAWLIDGFPRNEKHVTTWLKQMPPARATFYLYCDPDILISRISGRADGSGRQEDKDDRKVRERVERNLRESQSMLDTLEANGMPVIRVNTNKSMKTIEEELSTYFQHVMSD